MKKILSIFCVVALLLCALVVPTSAAGIKIKVDDVTEVEPGATVNVGVKIEGNEGICGAELSFTFDSALTLTKKATVAKKTDSWTDFTCVPSGNLVSPYKISWAGTDPDTCGDGNIITFAFQAPTTAGTYNIGFKADASKLINTSNAAMDSSMYSLEGGSITVKGSTPTPTPKTVSYTAANGTVFASLAPVTSFGEGAPVASGTIKTAGTDPEEAVYFYFFPNKGFTVEGMTIDGEPIIGSDISRKFTVTADKEFTFSFAKIADGATPTLAAVTGATTVKEATQFATFGTATGASDFGIIIAKGDTLKDEAGLKAAFEKASETGAIRKYAAEDANADGQFAIEVNGPLFAKGGTYIARMYAANGGNVTFGEIIDIAIAE